MSRITLKITLKSTIKYIFYLFIFLLPWQTRYIYYEGKLNGEFWEYGTKSLYATEILLLIIIMLYLAGSAYYIIKADLAKEGKTAKIFSNSSQILLAILFLIWALVSVSWSKNIPLAWYRWTILLQGVIVFLFLAKKIVHPRKVILFFTAGALIQSVFGIYQFFVQQVLPNKWLGIAEHFPENFGVSVVKVADQRWLRAYGALQHPNILAAYLGVALLLVIIYLLNTTSPRQYSLLIRRAGGQAYPPLIKGGSENKRLRALRKSQEDKYTDDVKEKAIQEGKKFTAALLIFLLAVGIVVTFSRAVWGAMVVAVIIFVAYLVFGALRHSETAGNRVSHKALAVAQESRELARGNLRSFTAVQDDAVVDARMTEWLFSIPAVGFMLLFCLTLFMLKDPILARLTGNERLEVKSNQERILSYQDGWGIIKDNWLLGAGIGNYTLELHKKNPNLSAWDYQPVHNVFMLVWAELGIIGLIIFLAFIFQMIKIAFKNYPIVVFLIFLLIVFLFDHYFWTLYVGVILWWFATGLITNMSIARDHHIQ